MVGSVACQVVYYKNLICGEHVEEHDYENVRVLWPLVTLMWFLHIQRQELSSYLNICSPMHWVFITNSLVFLCIWISESYKKKQAELNQIKIGVNADVDEGGGQQICAWSRHWGRGLGPHRGKMSIISRAELSQLKKKKLLRELLKGSHTSLSYEFGLVNWYLTRIGWWVFCYFQWCKLW